MKVLIVEDDADMRRLLVEIFASEDVEVEQASDGETVMRKIEGGYKPDLVLLDLHLPGVDGWEVFRVLREKTGSKIAVVTADVLAAPEFVKDADAVFTKPFSLMELLVKVKSMLGRAENKEAK
ncbi:MAG: response regulator transcription factor [Chloroflexota bacterium]|nr:response regulator transcription factor [Anaerolineales bacterium]